MTLHKKQNAKMRDFMPYLPMPDYFVKCLENQIKQNHHRIDFLAEKIFKYPDFSRILDEIETKYRHNLYDVSIEELNDPEGYWSLLDAPSKLNLGWATWFIVEATEAMNEKKYIWSMQCANEATLSIGQAQAHWENENARSKNSTKAADAKNATHREAKQKVINFYNEQIGTLFTGHRDKDYAAAYMAENKIVDYPVETIRKFLKTPFNDFISD